jgi:non-ribosomal peptide synthetase component F
LVEELRPERDLSHTPLFQVMFVLQNTPPQQGLELPGLRLAVQAVESVTAKFDLTLSMAEGDGELGATFEYNTDLFEAGTMARLARHFEKLLESIVAAPEQRLSEIEMLSDEERQQLLIEWNETAVEYPQEQCIHELFEAQVAAESGSGSAGV